MFRIGLKAIVLILVSNLSFGKCLSIESNNLHLFNEVKDQKIQELLKLKSKIHELGLSIL